MDGKTREVFASKLDDAGVGAIVDAIIASPNVSFSSITLANHAFSDAAAEKLADLLKDNVTIPTMTCTDTYLLYMSSLS